jgi:hypothetical protein
MISNGKTFKIKDIDLEKLWNFVVYNFFIWNHIGNEKISLNLSNMKFKYCTKSPKMKVVDLGKLWNFVVGKFLIWILEPQNNLHSVQYNISRMKTRYRRGWVCGVVVEEALCEGGCRGYDSRRPRCKATLHVWATGQWGSSPKKIFFYLFLKTF